MSVYELEPTPDPFEDLFPGKTDEEVADLARAFVLDQHCESVDRADDELPEPLGYEP